MRFLEYFIWATLPCVAIALYLGRDLNWDLHNYHFFAGYWAGRPSFDTMVMPAGIQSYLFPYLHAPFFWLTYAGVPDYLVAAMLAVIQSINLVVLRLIGTCLYPNQSIPWADRAQIYLLALCCPIFIVEMGTSFVDSIVSIPVLLGVYYLIRHFLSLGRREALMAGASFGLAVVLKLTNAIFLVAAVPVLLLGLRQSGKFALMSFFAGCLISLLLGWVLWYGPVFEEFENPFFPFFNAVFSSPYYPVENHVHARFVPAEFIDYFTFPIELSLPFSYLYTETRSPDFRVPVFFLLLPILCVKIWLSGGYSCLSQRGKISVGLGVFILFSWFLWLGGSANGRYGLPLLLLVGALLPVMFKFLVRRNFLRFVAVFSLVFVQFFALVTASELRWAGAPWTAGRWLSAVLPHGLDTEPALILAADSNSNSWLIPQLATGSSFVTIVGSYPVGRNSAIWEKVIPLEGKFADRVFALYSPPGGGDGKDRLRVRDLASQFVAHAGYELDPSADCEAVDDTSNSVRDEDIQAGLQPVRTYVCKLRRMSERGWRQRESRRKQVDETFLRVEKMCPDLFKPSVSSSIGLDKTWYKYYVDRDIKLVLTNDKVFVDSTIRDAIFVGSVQDIMNGYATMDCERLKALRWRLRLNEV